MGAAEHPYAERVNRMAVDLHEWIERLRAGDPPTSDDQSKTWDGRVLDSKETVLAFLKELDTARREGRSLEP
ncbi:MAG: hypothetical protein ACRD0L_07260 [Acidimicrobiales bacterium]